MVGNRSRLWSTLGGLTLIFVCWQVSLSVLELHLADIVTGLGLQAGFQNAAQEAQTMMVFLIIGFGPAFLVMLAWRKLVERAPVVTLFTARAQFRWSISASALILMMALGFGLTLWLDPRGYADIAARLARFDARDWAVLALAYGVGITIQSSFEEVFVRGWLLQHCVRFIPNVIASVIVTSCAFSLLHFGHAGWATYLVTLVLGLSFGWSVVRLNGLEAAIGVHVGNNLLGAMFAGQMINGNPATMDAGQILFLALYVLGFLGFVEAWARLGPDPRRS